LHHSNKTVINNKLLSHKFKHPQYKCKCKQIHYNQLKYEEFLTKILT